MNKVGLFIGLLAFLSFDATAQVRRCQIVQEFIKPIPHQNLYALSYEDIELKIINLGPDTIFASDNYSMSFRYGGVITFPDFDSVKQMVPPNSFFTFSKKFYLGFSYSVDSVAFCSDLMLYSRTDTLLDADSKRIKNNKTCVIENFIDTFQVGIDDLSADFNFNVFPNPFSDHLQLNFSVQQIKRIALIDVQGRTIPISVDVMNRIICNYNSMGQGVYYLILENVNGAIATQKLFKL